MNKKSSKKTNQSQDKFLMLTFFVLIILVVVLGIVALNMGNISKKENSNIIIPIIEQDFSNEMSIELNEMKKGDTKEYIFSVSNYRKSMILEEDVTYNLDIISTDSVKVSVYKNDEKAKLIENNHLLLTDNQLKSNKKKTDTYKLVIEALEQPSKEENITIKINN